MYLLSFLRLSALFSSEILLLQSYQITYNLFFRDFEEHFHTCEKDVVSFSNLGGDAFLVVPCPPSKDKQENTKTSREDMKMYGHLSAFVALSKDVKQLQNFWIKVAETFETRISQIKDNQPIWLSTCGTGVYWLHVRLDSRPKYYSYEKYRNLP